MAKCPPKPLSNTDVDLIISTYISLSTILPPAHLEQLDEYVEYALTEHKNGTICTHQNDKWSQWSVRDGRDSVMGTLCEFVAIEYYHRILASPCVVEFCPSFAVQKMGGDLNITLSTGEMLTVSVKRNDARENGKYRMGWDYFTASKNEIHFLAFVDLPSASVINMDYWKAKEMFSYYPHKIQNEYAYVSKQEIAQLIV